LAARVRLYNCDCHDYKEVAIQVLKATGCSARQAVWITQEAHVAGHAVAFTGAVGECERVLRVLRDIHLRAEIEEG
jgi:ATP-dependent Clp protease adapter protein ClpS